MKPLLSPGHISVPICKPDFDVWDNVLNRFWKRAAGYGRLESLSRSSDRRDAELMLQAQRDSTWLVAALAPGEWIYVRSMGQAMANFRAIL